MNQIAHKDFFNSPAVKQKFAEVVSGNSSQFVTSLLSVVNNSNLLMRASNESIMTAAMKAAVLNLPIEPSLGRAYLVPRKGQAQFQLGYKGLIELAQRSGKYKSINAGPVYKSQLVSYDPLFEELTLDFTQPQDEIVGYFAIFSLLNGFRKLTYWTKEEVEAHGKKFSMTFGNGPWKTDFDAMARKTVLKHILSIYGPLSVEMQEAIVADNETEDVKNPPVDVTPETQQVDLSDLLNSPNTTETPQSDFSQNMDNMSREGKSEQNTPKNLEIEASRQDTSYPVDEVPNFDDETGEVLDGKQGALFDQLGDLTK